MASTMSNDQKALYQQLFRATGSTKGETLEEEIRMTPLFTCAVKEVIDLDKELAGPNLMPHTSPARAVPSLLPNYGLLGFHIGDHESINYGEPMLLNVNAPNSIFLCGSQGSGKSYTLSCVLEDCLLSDTRIGNVPSPVAGVAFHYDRDSADSVAETAHLCSRGIKVKVLVSQSNEYRLRQSYGKLWEKSGATPGQLSVSPLLLHPSDLTTERMLKLMAFADKESSTPLYMEVVRRILRDMATMSNSEHFDYSMFKDAIEKENLSRDQLGPLNLRLDLLESFLDLKGKKGANETLFDLSPGTLTIIDLSDPFVDSASACVLFDICLSIIKEKRPECGLVVAIDEAHKYINKSPAASNFMDRLLGTIREQRHNATRVIIATQEPTISSSLLDLCSVAIIHRFTSPTWFAAIKGHLGGASSLVASTDEQRAMFERILGLNVGESLVFAPSAFVCNKLGNDIGKLGAVPAKMKTRKLLGGDGGASVLIERVDEYVGEPSVAMGNVRHELTTPDPRTYEATFSDRLGGVKISATGVAAASTANIESASSRSRVLDKDKAHLILICCLCKKLCVVEYSAARLPTYGSVYIGFCRNGIAYTSCSTCQTQHGTLKQAKAFDWQTKSAFEDGSIDLDETLGDNVKKALVPSLGQEIRVLSARDRSLYLLSRIAIRTVDEEVNIWILRLGSGKNFQRNLKLVPVEKDDFFVVKSSE